MRLDREKYQSEQQSTEASSHRMDKSTLGVNKAA